MKRILILLILLPLCAWAQGDLTKVMDKMAQKLVLTQGPDGRFEGTFEADPGLELLTLVLLKKYGHSDPRSEKEFITKALRWRSAEGFGYFPQGPYSHDVTGLVLLSLKALDADLHSLGLATIEETFLRRGGIGKLNMGSKILLAPLGLISSRFVDEVLSVSLLGIPNSLPFSQKKLGIFRSLIVPVTTWNYFKAMNSKRASKSPTQFGQALDGINWILHHQMKNGSWYTVFHTLVNTAALNEATMAGIGNFRPQINRGLEAIKRWRGKNSSGEITQQLTLTTGWDTPQTLIALSELPSKIKQKHLKAALKAVKFLDDHQIREKGDWAINSPDLEPGGWSFIVENRDYPDTDVVAAVLEAKLHFPENSSAEKFDRGLHWLLGLQNSDGGFPAWERGVSRFTDKIIKTLLPELPDYSDLSQTDVTARITRLLDKLKAHYPEENLGRVIQKSCRFIKKEQEPKGPFWKGRWLVAYLYGTAEAIDTLASVNCAKAQELIPSVEWLLKYQNTDGGFGEAHGSFETESVVSMKSTVMQTSYIVQGLIAFEELHKKEFGHFSRFKSSLDRAVGWLVKKAQVDDYLIKERSFTGVIGAKLWYSDYALSPQFMTLRALGRYARLTN
jgi:squalene cyclase